MSSDVVMLGVVSSIVKSTQTPDGKEPIHFLNMGGYSCLIGAGVEHPPTGRMVSLTIGGKFNEKKKRWVNWLRGWKEATITI